MAKVGVNPKAISDIHIARVFLEQKSHQAAKKFCDRFDRLLEQLSRFPRSGKRFGTSKHERREVIVEDYRIVYDVDDDYVEIMRVFHSSRNVNANNFEN